MIKEFVISVVVILLGTTFIYEGFEPNLTDVPVVIVFFGTLGIAGFIMVPFGSYGLIKTLYKIFFQSKKLGD